MSQSLIRAAFETRLKTWADAQTPAIPLAWQNVPFAPTPGRYARALLLPSPTRCDTLEGGHRRYQGIFQVSLVMPVGAGSRTAEVLAGDLDATFPMTFEHDGLRICLLQPMSAAPAIADADRYVIPVSAPYRVDVI